jgi:hypothetical protein
LDTKDRLSKLWQYLPSLIPSKDQVKTSLSFITFIICGCILLFPLMKRLPVVGWDWFFFFNGNNPNFNLLNTPNAYPPFASYLIGLFTWLPWRDSLAIINSISLLTFALATRRNGGGYGSIILALLTTPVFFLLWIGHPDGLALFGMLTGLLPFQLMKPQITIWNMFKNRINFWWTTAFLSLTLLIWPLWPLKLEAATLSHEVAFGWVVTGWPIAVLGFILFLGAGSNSYRLMASGCLMSPYLMPYHLAILVPSIGSARGYKKWLIWLSAWIMVIGVGMGGQFRILNLIFPISVYCLTHSWSEYKSNIKRLYQYTWKGIYNARLLWRPKGAKNITY